MFQASTLEMKKRIMNDPLLAEFYSHETVRVFYEHYTLLGAVFNERGMLHLETFLELSKSEFLNILGELGLLEEVKEDEPAPRFSAEGL